ncbi:hypothetical protein QEG73_02435 [Chitinophagaceae bacterium 26-R-25]|nr:hypothetical protein [Chitinophagaceae bacterium 26-R-25]
MNSRPAINVPIRRSSLYPAVLSLLILITFSSTSLAQYGLQFASRDADPEKRTSLNITPDKPICVSQKLDLSFELSFTPGVTDNFGYAFRMVNDKKQNLDMLYDQAKRSFTIVFGDAYTNISVPMLYEDAVNRWVKFHLALDITRESISLYCDDKLVQSGKVTFKENCFNIFFGATAHTYFKSSDVIPMRLRNVGLNVDDKDKYFWALNESEGGQATDSISGKKAIVQNEHWLRPKHSNWQQRANRTIKSWVSAGFDRVHELVYITGQDTIYIYSAKTAALTAVPLAAKHDLLPGSQTIYNPFNDHLYNFYPDEHDIAAYDAQAQHWEKNFEAAPLTAFWQVNKFFSRHDSSLYFMAGYGQLRYKNLVQRYHLATKKWDTVKTAGEHFNPRYLCALGTTPNGDTAYILGGYGSKDGDQLLNPQFYYDLTMYDVKTSTFKKIYTLKEPAEPFVFSNSMVIDKDGKHYYALINPKDQRNTQLQLIKGSLEKPEYELIGSSFPFTFVDVKSAANVYYCDASKVMLAVTLFTDKDANVTDVKIYSINFPPSGIVTPEVAVPVTPSKKNIVILAAIILAAIAFVVYKTGLFRSRSTSPVTEEKTGLAETVSAPLTSTANPAGASSTTTPAIPVITNEYEEITNEQQSKADAHIYLFGNFEVVASNGENITRLFTPLLKELFLLLCIHSLKYNKGVSPEKLIETLWSTKDTKDAINNRSVNIAKLKSILEKIEDCTLQKEFGNWKLTFDRDKLYIDLDHFLQLFAERTLDNKSINELIAIVQRGPFLPQTSYQWADSFKSEISSLTIDALLKYCQYLSLPDNAERVINICNAIFAFDELNENALQLKCKSLVSLGRHTLAKEAFEKFASKYKEIYAENYETNYTKMIS